jgi:very-short-patch-repair endonuclease
VPWLPALLDTHRAPLDVAAGLAGAELDRALEHALVGRLESRDSLLELLDRHRGGRGARALRTALDALVEPRLTRSEAERRLLGLVRAARLPVPEANVRLAGHEVDLLWRDRGFVVEVDGYAFHGGRAAFERDRRRDADLLAAGHRVLRVTWRQIAAEPEALVASLATTLAACTSKRSMARPQ